MLRLARDLKNAVNPSQTTRKIRDSLIPVIVNYKVERENLGKTYKKHDLFHLGYTDDEKTDAAEAFRKLLNGDAEAVTDEQMLALRNGTLGNELRAKAKELAIECNRPDIATIRGLITQLKDYPYVPENNFQDQANQTANKAKKALDNFGKKLKNMF